MKTRARTWWLLAGAILAAVPVVLLWSSQREPVYQGRNLSLWLEDYATDRSPQRMAQDAEAVRHIGTNALPWLVRSLAYEPPPWRNSALRFLGHDPRTAWVRRLLLAPQVKAQMAVGGFELLGPAARPALAELVQLAGTNRSVWSRDLAMSALRFLGQDGLPPLVAILEAGDPNAQRTAAECLLVMSASGVDLRQAVPGLLLWDRSLRQRLGIVDFDRGRYVSTLEWLEERSPDILVPALTNCLCHSNPAVRVEAALYLGHLGTNSVGVEPALTRAFNDPDATVRQAATNAVKQLAKAVLEQEKAGMPVNPTTGSPVKPLSGP